MKQLRNYSKLIIVGALLSTGHQLSAKEVSIQSCQGLPNSIEALQKKQYSLTDGTDSKKLYDLQREYDETLAEASIVQEFYKLNEQYFKVLNDASDPVNDIINHIEKLTSKENIETLKNIATMDALINDLDVTAKLKLGDSRNHLEAFSKIKAACEQDSSNKKSILCDNIGDEDTEKLVKSFLQAYVISTSNLPDEEKIRRTQAYRHLLRNGMNPDTDLAAMFRAAKELNLVKHNPAYQKLVDFNALADENAEDPNNLRKDLDKLVQARCCFHFATDGERISDPVCANFKEKYSVSECRRLKSSANTTQAIQEREQDVEEHERAFARVIGAYSNFEAQAYENLNYKQGSQVSLINHELEEGGIVIPRESGFRNFFTRIGMAQSGLERIRETAQHITGRVVGSENRTTKISDSMEKVTNQILDIFKRGKSHRSMESFLAQSISSISENQNSNSSAGSSNSAVSSELDMEKVADHMNKKICLLEEKVYESKPDQQCKVDQTGNPTEALCNAKPNCANPKDRYVKYDRTGENKTITIANGANLQRIFTNEENLVLAEDSKQVKEKLKKLKAQIDAIKNSAPYQHIDQIKSFMVWDLKNRCSDQFKSQDVSIDSSCIAGNNVSQIDYLVLDIADATSRLLGETDPDAQKRRNLTEANRAERRIILGHMQGACQGIESLKSESKFADLGAPAIQSACNRIARMRESAEETTQSERVAKIEKGNQYIDAEGRIRRRNSTAADIGIGAIRGLPVAVNTMATPFFSGMALKTSLPAQENYWKAVKFNDYASNWWMNNSPLGFPSMPYAYSPYYGVGAGGITATGFDFNQNGIITTP